MTAVASNTFSAASSDVSTYVDVCGAGQEAARFGVSVPGGSGSPTLEVALVDVDGGTTKVLGRFQATCTVTTKREGSGGSSGNYVCDVAFAEGGTSKLDLLGHAEAQGGSTALWKVGVVALDGEASAFVWWGVSVEV